MRQEFWDNRYRSPFFAYGIQPNAYMVKQAFLLHTGMQILAVGDGEGRNGVWLASQGMGVWSVDISQVGLEKAETLAAGNRVLLNTIQADLTIWDYPEDFFDAVISIFVHLPPEHRPAVHKSFVRSLKPGGFLIMQAFHKDQLNFLSGGPQAEGMLFTAEMLKDDFKTLKTIELVETMADLDEGIYHQGKAAVVNLTAQKMEI